MRMNKISLTSNQLKVLAMITMTVDHIGAYLFPYCAPLRMIGRLAHGYAMAGNESGGGRRI